MYKTKCINLCYLIYLSINTEIMATCPLKKKTLISFTTAQTQVRQKMLNFLSEWLKTFKSFIELFLSRNSDMYLRFGLSK